MTISTDTRWLLALTPADPVDHADRIFDLVWRTDFSSAGFCLIDLGPHIASQQLRAIMIDMKERLSAIAVQRDAAPFIYKSFVRSDQQVTTKFHLDGAPAASLLMLGYEPSLVKSRLSLADYSRCAFDRGMTPQQFLDELNPMFQAGESALQGYVSELPQPADGHARLLLINNSSLPFTDERRNPLGVLHKAEILTPLATAHRVVNSVMLAAEASDDLARSQVEQFMTTDAMSPRVY